MKRYIPCVKETGARLRADGNACLQAGSTMIETAAALAILAITLAAFLGGVSATSRSVLVSQERVISESLAKSQLESIKAQAYIPVAVYNPSDPASRYTAIAIPAELAGSGYAIQVEAPTGIISPIAGVELQSVTVMVTRNGSELLRVTDQRAGRLSG